MSLDAGFLIGFFTVFVRCSAMLLSSPMYGAVVPVVVRMLSAVVMSLAMMPVVQDKLPPMPSNLVGLILLAGHEALFGLLIGMCMQFLMAVFQIAGALSDLQLGIGSAQLFNPLVSGTATPLGQFKFWLGLVVLFLVNGHHMMFSAFVQSFGMEGPFQADPMTAVATGASMLGQLLMLSIQIAAPVIAVTVLIDIASGLVNKAVPQSQPFLLSLPAKLAVGVVVLGLGLPTIVAAVHRGVDVAFTGLGRLLGG